MMGKKYSHWIEEWDKRISETTTDDRLAKMDRMLLLVHYIKSAMIGLEILKDVHITVGYPDEQLDALDDLLTMAIEPVRELMMGLADKADSDAAKLEKEKKNQPLDRGLLFPIAVV